MTRAGFVTLIGRPNVGKSTLVNAMVGAKVTITARSPNTTRHAVRGVVSEGDVILQDSDLHFPHYVQIFESVIYLESVRKFEERFKKTFGAKVSDVMSTEVVTVEPSAPMREVATLMADREVNRVPVVAGGRVVGIITRGDLVRAMALESTE